MKLVCHKTLLLEIINTVQKAVSVKPAMDILGYIKLEAFGNGDIIITANNLDLCIEYKAVCPVSEGGTIALSSKMFGEIIRRLPDDDVHIKVNESNNVATITCRKSEFNIQGLTADEFPAPPEVLEDFCFTMNQIDIKKIIRKSVFAVSLNDPKWPVITGSLFKIEDGILNVVATDRHRLALVKHNIEGEIENKKFIIPGQTLREMLKILKDEETEVKISVSERHALFDLGNYKIFTRLIEGEYMNYNPVLASPKSIFLNVNNSSLCDSLERCALLLSEDMSSKAEKTPVRFNVGFDKIELSCITSRGQIHDVVDAALSGECIEIGFNHKYLLEALRSCDEEMVKMEFSHPVAPCFIRSLNDDEDYIYMVSPIRLNN